MFPLVSLKPLPVLWENKTKEKPIAWYLSKPCNYRFVVVRIKTFYYFTVMSIAVNSPTQSKFFR